MDPVMDPEMDVDMSADPGGDPSPQDAAPAPPPGPRPIDEAERRHAARIIDRIKTDKRHHKAAHDRMRRDMRIARRGADKSWPKDHYVANITGRHINQSVAALYAKNPKAVARRRERLDFRVWDESKETLLAAMDAVAQFEAAMAQGGMAGVPVDPMTGAPMVPPEVEQAVAVVQDAQQGLAERARYEKIGRTLEILFAYYMQEQKPVDFKTAMKQLVRRAKTCGAAVIEVGFQRPDPGRDGDVTAQIADARTQLRHMRVLQSRITDRDVDTNEADARELQTAAQSLASQEYVMLREGLVFDFPETTRVIPDRMCRSVVGFVGARWLTIEYLYTPDQVEGLFGVKLGRGFTPYSQDGKASADSEPELDLHGEAADMPRDSELACVWKHYDRQTGTVCFVADGHKGFLRPPEPPDVYVEDFWPVYALTFNDVEDPEHCFPPSDVELMQSQQEEHNRARQGKREHRRFARPRMISVQGILDDESKAALASAEPFSVTEVNSLGDNGSVESVIQAIRTPGVDPNLYDTGETMLDVQLVVGAQEARLGGVSRGTATESANAEASRIDSVDSNVDDMDAFLTMIARASGQILLRELSPQTVAQIAGPGAVWPQLSLDEIAAEITLEIEAGSSGKPNQAADIRNWREMLPFLLQMPTISPEWLARESLKRLDDRMDITAAITADMPAIVAINRQAQVGPADPGADPNAQGGEGGDRNPRGPQRTEGSDAPMGNNQV